MVEIFRSLSSEAVKLLEKEGFQTLTSEGTFDIAAKRDNELLLIKTLTNINGLQENQAMSLRVMSYFLSAHPFIIADHNSREAFNNGIAYSRFDIPVVTYSLFTHIISNDAIVIDSSKGRHTLEINPQLMKKKRNQIGMTLEELAKNVSVSKKAIYEIENKRVNPSEETVEKLEAVLHVGLKKSYTMKTAPQTHLRPENEFQKKVSREFTRIGIDNSSVYSAPFELIAKEKVPLITYLSYVAGHTTFSIKRFSSLFSSNAVLIAKNSKQKNLEGVPVLLESELPEIGTSRELSKLIKEKSN